MGRTTSPLRVLDTGLGTKGRSSSTQSARLGTTRASSLRRLTASATTHFSSATPRDTILRSPRESLLSTPLSSTLGSTRAVSPNPPGRSPRNSPRGSPRVLAASARVSAPVVVEDEVVNACRGQRLKFTNDVIEVINKKRCCCRKKDYEIKYSDIHSTVVEWHCFSGALVIETSAVTHRFRFDKTKLMQAASAFHRRQPYAKLMQFIGCDAS